MSAHTAGALRAAKSAVQVVIEHDGIVECDARDAAEMFAEIIDRETAAPELLQACKALFDALVRYGDDVDEEAPSHHSKMMEYARAAIAKAEGKQ